MSQTVKPNILMILIDDLGVRDLGSFGSTFYETPNLDRLTHEGLKFENAYASCPVCSPTRASLMSGKYPARVGITQFIGGKSEGRLQDVPYLHYLPLEEKSIATSLKEGGYQTWHVGKWHLGDEEFFPEHHGFDINIGGCHKGSPSDGYYPPYNIPALKECGDNRYLTDRITDESIELIKKRDPNSPFFLNLSHYAVHTPLQAPEELVEKYKKKAAKLGLDAINPIVNGDYMGCVHRSDQQIERRILQSHPVYAAMVENLDYNIGRVLETLKNEGLEEDTLVVFSSDNGGLATSEGSPTCNLPYSEGKGWNQEGGTRVCQMMRWPGKITPKTISTENTQTCDLYPTFLEAAGLPLNPEQHVDGISLYNHIIDGASLERECIYWHYPHYSNQGGRPAASLVSGNWKLIENFEDNSLELYDLIVDPSEQNNLKSSFPEKASELHSKLNLWKEEIEAKIPAPNPGWEAKMKTPKVANNAHI